MSIKAISMAALLVVAAGSSTHAFADNCEKVKADIAAKIDANGVPSYSLTAVDAGAAHDGKVVGHCGGNTKRIIYVRGAVGPEPASAPAAEPASEPAPSAEPAAPDAPAAPAAAAPASP